MAPPPARARQSEGAHALATRIDMPADRRGAVVDVLNARLADAVDLRSQAKHAHWNVKGTDFYQLHLLFDKLALDLDADVDRIAERVAALGGLAEGTVRAAGAASSLPDFPAGPLGGVACVTALAERWGEFASVLRAAVDETESLQDKTTASLFADVSERVEQGLYLLEAHLHASAPRP